MEQPLQRLQNDSTSLDMNSTGDKCSFLVVRPIKIKQVGLCMLTTEAGGATVKFDRRVKAGSDSGRGDGDVGIITVPASDSQGKILSEDEAASADLILDAGDEIVVEVTAENVSANAFFKPFVEYYVLSESLANMSDRSAA